jgi:hypothetical protein
MSDQPNPLQTLFLWRLLATDGGEFLKKIKPELSAKDRNALAAAGLIETDKRKEPNPKKGARAITYIALSDKGWQWAADHLDAKISTSSNAAPILQSIMTKLKSYLATHQGSLADFICGTATVAQPPSAVCEASRDVPGLVRSAYARLTGGQSSVRVRLADLRAALAEVSRADLDSALLDMERNDAIILYPLDDPQETRAEDEAASLPNSAGAPRHIVYMRI